MIRHYVARRAQVIEDHPHNAAAGASGSDMRSVLGCFYVSIHGVDRDYSRLARSQTRWTACCGKRIDVNVELQVGVELQAVAVRIAHVELTCAPAGVGDLGAIDNPPELLR